MVEGDGLLRRDLKGCWGRKRLRNADQERYSGGLDFNQARRHGAAGGGNDTQILLCTEKFGGHIK